MRTVVRLVLGSLLVVAAACPAPPGEDAGALDAGSEDAGAVIDAGDVPVDAGSDAGGPCERLDEACDDHDLLLCLNGEWIIGTTCEEPSYCHLDGRGNASCAGLEDSYCREDLAGFGPVPCAVGLGCSLGVPVNDEVPGTCVVDPPTCTRALECVGDLFIKVCTEVSPIFRDCGAGGCVPDVGCVAIDAGPGDAGSDLDAGGQQDAGDDADAGAEASDAGADAGTRDAG